MTTKEVLQAARDYITDPEKWTQGNMERGNRVCALGALVRVRDTDPSTVDYDYWAGEPALGPLAAVVPPKMGPGGRSEPRACAVANYNDHHDHACVLAAFDTAIERAEP